MCGVVGRATACICGDAGSIPTSGALKVWPWTLGCKTAWSVSKSAGQPVLFSCTVGESLGSVLFGMSMSRLFLVPKAFADTSRLFPVNIYIDDSGLANEEDANAPE